MKYELTDNKENGLTQIRALKDFGSVKAGDLGGWIESEKNLSQEGYCWVYGNARVFGDAWVYGDAWVSGDAQVYGNAGVYGNAEVYGNVRLTSGRAFATKHNSWNITEVDNGDGTITLYADAEFEEVEAEQAETVHKHITIDGVEYALVPR